MHLSRNSFMAQSGVRKSRYGQSSQLIEKNSNTKKRVSQSFMYRNPKNNYNTVSYASDTGSILNDDEKIAALISKNDRLKMEIKKIQKVLQQNQEVEKPKQYGVKLPEIRADVAESELQNAYKQINQYQHEIQRMKNLQKQGSFASRLTKAQRLLKQKVSLRDKLTIQLQKLQKTSKDVGKSLEDDKTKIYLENRSKKLNDELKMYEKKMEQVQRKQAFHSENQEKKKVYILQLQKQLRQSGLMKHDIQNIRNQIFVQNLRSISYNDQKEQKEIIQDRTLEAYENLANEIKLLKKVTVTNENIMEKYQSQREQYATKNKKLNHQMKSTDNQIEIITNEISFLKKHVDPSKLKPKSGKGFMNPNVSFNLATFSSGNSSFQPYANRDKSVLEHHFQFSQIGVANKRAQKFNDRKVLGKRSAKIVGLTMYWNRMQLLGFQSTYVAGQQRITGVQMMIKNQNQRRLQKKQIKLQPGDFFATIECFIHNGIIVGIIVISQAGVVAKAGSFEGSKRYMDLTPKQYPVCFYSSIGKQGIQLIGVQKVEPELFQK